MTSFALPKDLHARLMIAGVRLNWTLAEVLRAAGEAWLARHEKAIASPATGVARAPKGRRA